MVLPKNFQDFMKHRVNNKEILRRIKEKRQIWKIRSNRRDNMIGHTLRHARLLKLNIEGYKDSKSGRGRLRMEYTSHTMQNMNMGIYRDFKEFSFVRETCQAVSI